MLWHHFPEFVPHAWGMKCMFSGFLVRCRLDLVCALLCAWAFGCRPKEGDGAETPGVETPGVEAPSAQSASSTLVRCTLLFLFYTLDTRAMSTDRDTHTHTRFPDVCSTRPLDDRCTHASVLCPICSAQFSCFLLHVGLIP